MPPLEASKENISAPAAAPALELESESNAGFGTAFLEAIRQPVNGIRQIAGQDIDPAKSDGSFSSMAGNVTANSLLFIGGSLAARRIPVIGTAFGGKLASITAGGAIGFLTPVAEGQGMNERLANAGVGAAAMGLMEFGPSVLSRAPLASKYLAENSIKNGMIKAGIANGAAGLLNTDARSLINEGHLASWDQRALGVGSWALMGAAFYGAGQKYGQYKENQASAKAWLANEPWQFKNVQDINTASLKPNQLLQAPGNYRVKFNSQGHEREFVLYVSEGAAKSSPGSAPVVTFLHGLNPKGQGEKIIRELEYNRFADRDGGIVAYLQGKNGLKGRTTGDAQSWNEPNFGFTKHDPSYGDTVAFDDMMRIIRQRVPAANTDRIAVSGFSLGGKEANIIAAERPDVRAVATLHGTTTPPDLARMAASSELRPVNYYAHLGTNDKVLPREGGAGIFTAALDGAKLSRPAQQAEFWGELTGGQAVNSYAQNYTRRSWISPDRSVRVVEDTVRNGTHALDGAQQKHNLIQFLMGAPKPANYYDARANSWNFMVRALRKADETASSDKLVVSA